jgi:hypothetical protein
LNNKDKSRRNKAITKWKVDLDVPLFLTDSFSLGIELASLSFFLGGNLNLSIEYFKETGMDNDMRDKSRRRKDKR